VSWRNTVAPQAKQRLCCGGWQPAVLTVKIASLVRIMQPDHMSCVTADLSRVERMPVRRIKSTDKMPNGMQVAEIAGKSMTLRSRK
jgi:hypothetical protein